MQRGQFVNTRLSDIPGRNAPVHHPPEKVPDHCVFGVLAKPANLVFVLILQLAVAEAFEDCTFNIVRTHFRAIRWLRAAALQQPLFQKPPVLRTLRLAYSVVRRCLRAARVPHDRANVVLKLFKSEGFRMRRRNRKKKKNE
jgi:hypothetical protein